MGDTQYKCSNPTDAYHHCTFENRTGKPDKWKTQLQRV